ncbi:glycosyltransferase family 2 protein [uncultured Hyphomonas sp.]|uniref:glycosyltransferase family 2 protein n=1 Tax=uncultured Hyphomonas sp. TaxID=225298 RepID=UPI002AAB404D|nr:glycosyltransferase family 2 protein [uncultured Hyphomonas sp.]
MTENPRTNPAGTPGNASPDPVFSVVIVNYNGGAYVQAALDSLGGQTRRDFEVLLVDNASTDGSVDNPDVADLPAFTLMAETENHGYARGTNLGARRAKGEWIVCLNPDAVADPDFLDKIADGIRRHPGVGMFASAQYNLEDPSLLDGAGDAYLIFGIPWRGGFLRPATEMPEEGECFSPCGAGAVFRRELFLAHGGFDEEFFCYCEDVDLGFRLRLAGDTCIFLPRAVIHHVGGGLSGRASDFSIYHGTRNRVWTYAKDMPGPILWLTLPGHITLSLYLLMRGAMVGRVRETWRGMRDGLKDAARMRRKGQETRRSSRVPLWRLARTMAWNPWRMSQHRVHVRKLSGNGPVSSPSASEAL